MYDKIVLSVNCFFTYEGYFMRSANPEVLFDMLGRSSTLLLRVGVSLLRPTCAMSFDATFGGFAVLR